MRWLRRAVRKRRAPRHKRDLSPVVVIRSDPALAARVDGLTAELADIRERLAAYDQAWTAWRAARSGSVAPVPYLSVVSESATARS